MRELRLVAVSEDGSHLVLQHGDELLALRVDDRLHAAIRGDRARLGQLDIQLESQLRPRDIQARIRAGESVDAVAAVAGMPREKVERFAGPVIAEREHVASRARQATVRRLGGDGPPQTLDAAATATTKVHGADPELVEWDAWRREDGRWLVRFSWAGDEEDSALFSFDPSGRTVVPEDDNARAIAGVLPAQSPPDVQPVAPPAAAPTGPARLSVVGSPARDDVDEVEDLDAEDEDGYQPTTPIPVVSRRNRRTQQRTGRGERRRRDQELWPDQGDERAAEPAAEAAPAAVPDTDDEATSERLRLRDIAQHVDEQVAEEPAPAASKQASAGSGRPRRPSVPSWDEIMFGRRKND